MAKKQLLFMKTPDTVFYNLIAFCTRNIIHVLYYQLELKLVGKHGFLLPSSSLMFGMFKFLLDNNKGSTICIPKKTVF